MIAKKGIGRSRHLEVTSKDRVARRKRRRRRLLIIFIALFLILWGAIIGILHLGVFRIQKIAVSGAQSVAVNEIENTAKKSLEGSYFFLVPHNSIFFYPREKIEKEITEKYPEVKKFKVELSSPGELSITLVERISIGEWCDTDGGVMCYFIDDEGVLFATAPQISGNVYFTYMGPLEHGTSSSPLKATYMESGRFKKVNEFLSSLKDHHIFTPVSFAKTGPDEGTIATSEGVNLMVKTDSDFAAVELNLTSALNASSLKDPKVKAKLEYIDLRFGSKLYYKLRGESAPVTPKTSQ